MTTVLSEADALGVISDARTFRSYERNRLERVFQYLRDPDLATAYRHGWSNMGPLRWLRQDTPQDVLRLAEMSRVNLLRYIVNSATQVLYVDGYRSPKSGDDQPGWDSWQKNNMDARQIGIHRAAISYGASYGIALPGTNGPIIRGASPRRLTAVYGDDDLWPEYALEIRDSPIPRHNLWRLYDSQNVFVIDEDEKGRYSVQNILKHGAGVTPVVRYLSAVDDDGVVEGEVQPYFALQDQINVTTFSLLVSQHYGAFRQRYVLGWVADSEEQALTASARKLWTFEDPDVKVGEFNQTDLNGYIASREASLRHLATVSQTPAHELLGELVNMSAEALQQAEASFWRKSNERQKSLGESHEQLLELSAGYTGTKTPDSAAEVRWRDTTNRALSQTADALGKLVTGLGVPPQELWELIPGITQQQVEAWKIEASKADAITQLNEILTKQTAKVDAPDPDKAQITQQAPVSAPEPAAPAKATPATMPKRKA
jgi:hypothetical protein